MVETLYVFWDKSLVGRLIEDREALLFQYDDSWLTSSNGVPISARLPLRQEPFPDETSRCFFANLLPEGYVRPLIARRLGISEGNDFALLKALGGDCAGALSLWPDSKLPDRPAQYRKLAPDQLDELIDQMASAPLISSGAGLRLSLAGAQQKLPLVYRNGEFFLPEGSAPSSHIVKPDIEAYPGSSVNEAFCLELASVLGLPVPKSQLWRGRHTALIVERYDRLFGPNSQWTRLHQEDFCQSLGYPHHRKYESDGGPTLRQSFELLTTQSTQPIPDKNTLLRATIFNACVGNMDAHAKNFSMLIDERSYRLAPLYDLISTRIYGSLSPKLAMRIGGQVRTEWLTRKHWEKLAEESRIAPKMVVESVRSIADQLPVLSGQVRQHLESRGENEKLVLDKLGKHLTESCKLLLGHLASDAR